MQVVGREEMSMETSSSFLGGRLIVNIKDGREGD